MLLVTARVRFRTRAILRGEFVRVLSAGFTRLHSTSQLSPQKRAWGQVPLVGLARVRSAELRIWLHTVHAHGEACKRVVDGLTHPADRVMTSIARALLQRFIVPVCHNGLAL